MDDSTSIIDLTDVVNGSPRQNADGLSQNSCDEFDPKSVISDRTYKRICRGPSSTSSDCVIVTFVTPTTYSSASATISPIEVDKGLNHMSSRSKNSTILEIYDSIMGTCGWTCLIIIWY